MCLWCLWCASGRIFSCLFLGCLWGWLPKRCWPRCLFHQTWKRPLQSMPESELRLWCRRYKATPDRRLFQLLGNTGKNLVAHFKDCPYVEPLWKSALNCLIILLPIPITKQHQGQQSKSDEDTTIQIETTEPPKSSVKLKYTGSFAFDPCFIN